MGDDRVCVVDLSTGEEVRAWRAGLGEVYTVATSPDGRWIAGGGRRRVRVWDAATGQRHRTLRGYFGMVAAVSFVPRGNGLLVASSSH